MHLIKVFSLWYSRYISTKALKPCSTFCILCVCMQSIKWYYIHIYNTAMEELSGLAINLFPRVLGQCHSSIPTISIHLQQKTQKKSLFCVFFALVSRKYRTAFFFMAKSIGTHKCACPCFNMCRCMSAQDQSREF